MRIQNNVTAMNTHRMYTMNNDAVAASAKKLSSGYRINSAADDAAGLAISEKMRSQIRGLNMATKNSQDAISLVQTAEGALQETQNMLQRMNELAVQAATGTNEDLDRTALSKEFEQLKREINDVAEQTNFNNMKILDGSLSYKGYVRSAQTAGVNMTIESTTNEAAGAIKVDMTAASASTTGAKAQIGWETNFADDTAIAVSNGKDHQLQLQLGNQTVTLQANGKDYSFAGVLAADGSDVSVKDALGASYANAPGKLTATLDIDGQKVDVEFDTATGVLSTVSEADVDLSGVKLNLMEFEPSTPTNITKKGEITTTTGTDTDVKGVSKVSAAANPTATTEITIDQNTLQNGDSVKIGDKTYQFYAKGAKDASGNEIKSGVSSNTVTIVYDPDDANSAATLLKDAIGGTFTGKETGAQSVSGAGITAATAAATTGLTGSGTANSAVGALNVTVAGNKVTVSQAYTAETGKGTAKEKYDLDVANAEGVNTAVAAEASTKGTTDSKTTTIEFDVAKMKKGDQFDITIGNKTVNVTYNGESRADFMNKVVKNAIGDLGEVKGNAVIVKDKDVEIELNTKWEKEPYADQTNALRIQVGALENEQLSIAIDSMNTASLGLDNSFLAITGNSNDQNIDEAGKAITAVRDAINKVSDQRATLGAMQNRLDHKIANLKTTAENLTASESRIRDVDMAEEMTNFTKNNILSQAATAMLAQANSLPQNVLSLLG